MNWLQAITYIVKLFPIERVLFPPPDATKAFREFAASAGAPQMAAGELIEIPTSAPKSQKSELLTATVPQTLPEENQEVGIATACVPCAIGHVAGAARLLNEAVRFRDEGITSNQVLDDIAGAIGELNAMERVDLTPERLQSTSSWERLIADEALRESRKLRHRLEGIGSMEEIEKAAADTESYYKKLNRQWYRGRFDHMKTGKDELADYFKEEEDA